jgi:hypothetical protein
MPTTADFDTLVTDLRRWADGMDATDRAALELLIWHRTWLHRPDFVAAAVVKHGPETVLSWRSAREFADLEGAQSSSPSELAILDLAIALGEDRFRLISLCHPYQHAAAAACAAAAGLELNPASCPRCTQEASHG